MNLNYNILIDIVRFSFFIMYEGHFWKKKLEKDYDSKKTFDQSRFWYIIIWICLH